VREGRFLNSFKYSGCKIVSYKDYERLLVERIAAIRAYVAVSKEDKEFNAREKEKERTTPGHIAERRVNVDNWRGVNVAAENPYLARATPSRSWRDVARTDKGMGSFVCVTEMMKHVMWESAAFFKGTNREECWRVYHDGLTTWMAVDAQEYLKTLKNQDGSTPLISFFNRQVLISRWSNEDERVATNYKSRITGNRHEKMPLDTQLFAGVSSDLLLNIVATRGLDKTDFRKFDFDKYDIAFRSMERVFQKIPESRIFQDCGRWRELFAKIITAPFRTSGIGRQTKPSRSRS